MIAVDTSTWVAFLEGADGPDVEALDQALEDSQVALPPVVLTELMSSQLLKSHEANLLRDLPLLEIGEGYWERTGRLRVKVLALGRKAALADSLITQSCLDHQIPLLTRDRDFLIHSDKCGLKLVCRP